VRRADNFLDLPELAGRGTLAKSDPKPAIAMKAQRYLVAGYERLLRYQAESGGFSYWGHGEAADIALTGYALEFLDHAATLTSVEDGVFRQRSSGSCSSRGRMARGAATGTRTTRTPCY
jgi:uncharacterized protein YfaS (alpha-2-macroglobulin family)